MVVQSTPIPEVKPKRSHHKKKPAPASVPSSAPPAPPAPPIPAAGSAASPAIGARRPAVPAAEPNTDDALQADPQRGISAILRALRDADLDMTDEEAYALVKRLRKAIRALPLELD